jgi:hypothetical protein
MIACSDVRVLLRSPNRTHHLRYPPQARAPELHSLAVGQIQPWQFFAMVCFAPAQRRKFAALGDCPTISWEVGTRMRAFNPQCDSPEAVLEKHISVKAAADLSGYRALSRPLSQTSSEKR